MDRRPEPRRARRLWPLADVEHRVRRRRHRGGRFYGSFGQTKAHGARSGQRRPLHVRLRHDRGAVRVD